MDMKKFIIRFNLDIVILVLLGILVVLVYFIPTIVGLFRHDIHVMGIFVLNLFLGCTFIGWVGALIWAVSDSVH